jgi:hypothetical protein
VALEDLIAKLQTTKDAAENAQAAETALRVRYAEEAKARVLAAETLRETIRDQMLRVAASLCDTEIQVDRIPFKMQGADAINLIAMWFRVPGAEPKLDCLVTFATRLVAPLMLDQQVQVLCSATASYAGSRERRIDRIASHVPIQVLSLYAVRVQVEEALESAIEAALKVQRALGGARTF